MSSEMPAITENRMKISGYSGLPELSPIVEADFFISLYQKI
jgi:hypothetical protein